MQQRAAPRQLSPTPARPVLELEPRLVSPWLARKDADWSIERLYDFVADLGVMTIPASMARTGIDVNQDPSGFSLYPG